MTRHWEPHDRGQSWDDGVLIARTLDDDGAYAERVYGRLFGWDSTNSTWRRVLVDATGALTTTGGGGGGGSVTQGTSPWVVSGSITVSNFPATQPVSGTFWQTTQPVSGPLTDTQLRASTVPVSGTVAAITGGLTDTQLRASAVPVSLATNTPDVTDRVARQLGLAKVWDGTNTAGVDRTFDASASTEVGLRTSAKLMFYDVGADTYNRARGDTTNGLWVNVKAAASTAVTGPLTDTQLRATPVPVSGTVATGGLTDTQLRASAVPVSLATNTPDVTDRAGRLLGIVDKGKIWDGTNIAAVKAGVIAVAADNPLVVTVHPSSAPTVAQPVTGTFFQATQPVSLATNTPDVTDRAARLLGVVDKGKVWDGTNIAAVKAGVIAVAGDNPLVVTMHPSSAPVTTQPVSAATLPLPTGAATSANQSTLKAASTIAAAADTASVVQHSPQRADAATLCVTNTAATGVACTLTIPAAAAGLFHYISLIEIQLYATAARTGGATPVLVTTTNLPGSPVWDFDTAQAVGNTIRQLTTPATPIKSSVAATATTIVAPIATTGIWRITAYYYTAP